MDLVFFWLEFESMHRQQNLMFSQSTIYKYEFFFIIYILLGHSKDIYLICNVKNNK